MHSRNRRANWACMCCAMMGGSPRKVTPPASHLSSQPRHPATGTFISQHPVRYISPRSSAQMPIAHMLMPNKQCMARSNVSCAADQDYGQSYHHHYFATNDGCTNPLTSNLQPCSSNATCINAAALQLQEAAIPSHTQKHTLLSPVLAHLRLSLPH